MRPGNSDGVPEWTVAAQGGGVMQCGMPDKTHVTEICLRYPL